ncbi:MAG: hypothetical protein KDB07_02505, partial [Planctomycetes bacterium]|nr:hypothetical protein [Planctomycetota bacterium]
SIITGPVNEMRDPAGNLTGILTSSNYPNRDIAGGAFQLPLKNWNAPPAGDPFAFPPSQQAFTSNQFSIIGLIRVRDVSSGIANGGVGGTSGQQGSGGNAALSLGAAIQDQPSNPNVETMLSIPARNLAGQAIAVQLPVGLFSDNYAQVYRTAPVRQPSTADPNAIPPVPPASLADPELEDALIEYSRHMASALANILG